MEPLYQQQEQVEKQCAMMPCVKYSHMPWAMCLRIDQNLESSRTIIRCVSNHDMGRRGGTVVCGGTKKYN